jgi:transketolase
LIAIVDFNRLQSTGVVADILPIEPLAAKWMAFGWNVLEIDGHDMSQVVAALDLAIRHEGRPSVIIAQTVKGKGVSFMENEVGWHQKAPDESQFEQAMAELQGDGVDA